MTCHGWLSWLPRTLFVWLLVSVGFLTTRVAQAASSPLGKALAMARPGVTYVQTIYEGSVRYHDRTYGPYQVGIHGSGVSVTPDGYIVTLAAVVDLPPVDVARLVIGAFEDDARQATQRRLGRSLTADDREQITRVVRTDVTMGSVRRRVRVRVGSAIVAADNEVAEAQVVRERTEAAPDLALLKIEHGSVPTVPLNRRSEATTDGGVVCLGFPGGGMVATRSGAAQPLETTLVTSGTTGAPGLSMALDVAVSPGFQAGPCFSGDGTMIGLLGQPRAGTIKASSTARLILMKTLDQLLPVCRCMLRVVKAIPCFRADWNGTGRDTTPVRWSDSRRRNGCCRHWRMQRRIASLPDRRCRRAMTLMRAPSPGFGLRRLFWSCWPHSWWVVVCWRSGTGARWRGVV